MKQRQCTGTTKAGNPCQSFAMKDSNLCMAHDPDRREDQLKASRAGGLAKANAVRSAKEWAQLSRHLTLQDLPGVLIGAGLASMSGEIEPARVQALSTSVRTAVQIAEAAILEDRIREIEELLGVDKHKHRH